jgi:hypothetical protein
MNQNYPTYATAPPEGFWRREVEFLKAQLVVEKRMKQIEDVILFQATSTKPKMEERIEQIEAKVDQLLALGILQQEEEEEEEEEEGEQEEREGGGLWVMNHLSVLLDLDRIQQCVGILAVDTHKTAAHSSFAQLQCL